MNSSKSNVICIIGMHRSGTSMVAQLLHQAGLFLGSADQLLGANSGNQDGHFEHQGFFKINEELLKHFGASWQFPPKLERGWERDDSLATLFAEARALLQTFSGKSSWGWKEPRTTILLPFWKSLIPSLRFVICVRSPLDVAKSLGKRDGLPIESGVVVWNRYVHAAIEDTQGYPRLLAFYDDFFLNRCAAADKLLRFCGLQMPNDSFATNPVVREELRHYKSEMTDLLEDRSIPTEYKLKYLGLHALSGNESASTVPEDVKERTANHLLQLFDSLHDEERLVQLQSELMERDHELLRLRKEIYRDLRANHRWAYRVYRNFIRPFRVRHP
jgi:hypothetical protein